MQKFLLVVFACASSISIAQTPSPKRDDFAKINSSCAAFYDIAKEIVKPAVKHEYVEKFNVHTIYAKQLHESTQSVEKRYEADLEKRKSEFSEAQAKGSLNEYFSKGMVNCSSVEFHTLLVIKEHKLKLNR